MKFIALILFCIPQITLASASLQQIRQDLERANLNVRQEIEHLGIESGETVLSPDQYKQIKKVLTETLITYHRFHSDLGRQNLVLSPRRQSDMAHLLKNLIYFTNSGLLFMTVLTQPNMSAVLSELQENNLPFNKRFVRNLIFKTRNHFSRPSSNSSLSSRSSGNLYEAIDASDRWRIQSTPEWLSKYIDSAKQIIEYSRYLSLRNYTNLPHKRVFYQFKSAILFLTGKVALPKNYFIKNSDMVEIRKNLQPGDIATIKHFYKLTNLAFNGEWSHGVIYLGSWNKMSEYFNSDRETTMYFRSQCRALNLACDSFPTFLEEKLPNVVAYYKSKSTYRGHDIPRVALESKGEGVIISNIYDALKKDQLAVLRPHISKLAKAQAITKALEYVFLPYDYRFSLHSQKSLVCTEVIYNAYSPGAGPNLPDFEWEVSTTLGKPINYATDLIKTFANTYGNSSQKLDFVIFYKANLSNQTATPAGVELLINTVH